MKKVFVFILMLVLPMGLAAQNTTIDPNHDYTNPHRDLGNSSYIDWNRILDDYWPVSTITCKKDSPVRPSRRIRSKER